MAILNSKLCWWYLVNTGTVLANGYFRYKPNYIKPFPVPTVIPPEIEIELERLVDELIIIKQKKASDGAVKIDKKINQLVYTLYNLTQNDINVIEQS